MPVDERARVELYRTLEDHLGPAAADTLMAHLPPVGWADVATKADLAALEARVDARFDALEGRLEGRFEAIDHRFEAIDHRFASIEHRFDSIQYRFDSLDHRFAAMDLKIDAILGRIDGRLADFTRSFFFALGALFVSVAAVVVAAGILS